MTVHAHISDIDDSEKPIRESVSLIPITRLLQLSPRERKAVRISSHSVFGDHIWDFSDYDKTSSRHELLLKFDLGRNFQALEAPLLDSVQCFAFSLLTDPPRPRIGMSFITRSFQRGGIVNLLRFMVKRDICSFSDLSRSEFDIFLEHERTRPHKSNAQITDRTLRARVRGIEWLFQQSDKLEDTLRFDPWAEHGSYSNWALSRADVVIDRDILRTEVIPDDAVKKLILTSIHIIDESSHLLKVIQARNSLGPVHKSALQPHDQFSTELQKTPKFSSLEFHSFEFRSLRDIDVFYCHIRTATAILIGLLTGMRPAEILSIPSDPEDSCVQEDIEINGTKLKCGFVVSLLSKTVPTPQNRTWQTIPIVLDAIRSLAEINNAISKEKTPWLFRSYKTRARQGHIHDQRKFSACRLSRSIQSFISIYDITTPSWKGHISARSLRRTFARLLTRNGLGLLELQDQLKHFDPDISRMYGQPSLALHLHEEKVSHSEELYQELLAGVVPIIGGGAPKMNNMRSEFQGLTRVDQKKFIKSLSKQALVDQVDSGLCIYRPDRALCGGNKFNCQPDVCLNSVIPLNSTIKSLTSRKRENERLLRLIPATSSLQRQHLHAQLKTINNLLAQAGDTAM